MPAHAAISASPKAPLRDTRDYKIPIRIRRHVSHVAALRSIPARFEVTFTQFPAEGDKRGRLGPGLGSGVGFEEEESLAAKAAERTPLYSAGSSNSEIAQKILLHFAAT